MELLLSLRQPQLAKRLELDHGIAQLQNSLPPLAENLLATAAEAFRSLDADRRQLQASRQRSHKPKRSCSRIVSIAASACCEPPRRAYAQRGYENATRSCVRHRTTDRTTYDRAQQHDEARRQAEAEVLTAEATMSRFAAERRRTVGRTPDGEKRDSTRARDALQKLEEAHERWRPAAEAAAKRRSRSLSSE